MIYSVPKEVISLIFRFQSEWKFFFHCEKLLSVEKLHLFCIHYNANMDCFKYFNTFIWVRKQFPIFNKYKFYPNIFKIYCISQKFYNTPSVECYVFYSMTK